MIEVINCEQNSAEWRTARCGIITASNFATVLANGRGGGESITRKKLLYQLAGEIITGEPAETYSNAYMERGHRLEEEARDFYAFLTDTEPQIVGFVRNGNKGCSPDSFLGSDGLLEIKTKTAAIQAELLLRDQFPPEHKAQVQGQIWICEREYDELFCYSPKMPPLRKRAYRDSSYIRTLSQAVDQFNDELYEIVEKLRAYGHQTQGLAA